MATWKPWKAPGGSLGRPENIGGETVAGTLARCTFLSVSMKLCTTLSNGAYSEVLEAQSGLGVAVASGNLNLAEAKRSRGPRYAQASARFAWGTQLQLKRTCLLYTSDAADE